MMGQQQQQPDHPTVLHALEVPLLLEAAGLELAARYGDFAGNPLTGESLNQICLARSTLAKSDRNT